MSIQHASAVTMAGRALEVSVSPSQWSALFTNAQSPQSQAFSSTVTGGVPTYTYAWSLVAATGFSFVSGTTSSGCTISCSGLNQQRTGTLRLQVTDALGRVKITDVNLDVAFEP